MLMEPQELHARQSQGEDIRILDCRFQLGNLHYGSDAFQTGHIPHAQYINLEDDLSGSVSAHGGRHPLPDFTQLAEKLGALGISNDVPVVVYDAGEGMATRAWWLLRFIGHNNVCVLNGGLDGWTRAGFKPSTEQTVCTAASFQLNLHPEWLVDVAYVESIASRATPGTLVDARAAGRYRGEMESVDPVAGHIPTAQNAPWVEGVDAEGRWKDAAAQRARFAPFIAAEGPVVAYCGSGVTACANVFAMTLAGLPNVKLYNGSWSDWISYPHHAIATGAPDVEQITPRN